MPGATLFEYLIAALRQNRCAPYKPPKVTLKQRKLKWAEEKELETIEETIMEAEENVARLETLFNAPDFYEKNGDNWQELEAELKAAKEKAPLLYARWEELEEIKKASEA